VNCEAREPCKSCPYRKDVKPGTWHRSEFVNLVAQDRNDFGGHQFGCHQHRKLPEAERGACVGWLLDQRKRGTPSIQLRMTLITKPEACEQFNQAHAPEGVALYSSIAAMCRANKVRP
jgi:hypothetical protein